MDYKKMTETRQSCRAFDPVRTPDRAVLTQALGAKLKDQDYRAADIGLAVSQLVYRAHELGLSTCILGWFDEKTLQALLNTNARVRLIIAIGYARADDALRTKKRKSLEELVTWL